VPKETERQRAAERFFKVMQAHKEAAGLVASTTPK
jgi:hypothetical protein